ncbi:hypothetical protein [Rheinheimera sp.]|uniref:hypothetical protein n=1 Tax=Rheinheimera sp. TaxID=1869214 RepID=UPI002353B9E5|nr:hypothetical protein [Rheinheimera sp.]
MEKIIVLSIKPVFSEEIYKLNKRVELRRGIGKCFKPNSQILIYSTSPLKAITGSARIHYIEEVPVTKIVEQYAKDACIDSAACSAYFSGKSTGYLIWLMDVVRYKEPIYLSDLKKVGFTAPQSYSYATSDLTNLVSRKCQL